MLDSSFLKATFARSTQGTVRCEVPQSGHYSSSIAWSYLLNSRLSCFHRFNIRTTVFNNASLSLHIVCLVAKPGIVQSLLYRSMDEQQLNDARLGYKPNN